MGTSLGPWSYGESKGGKWFVYDAEMKPLVPNVCVHKGQLANKRIVANARLIAVAPEMQTLLQIALECAEDESLRPSLNWINDAKQVLRRGER